MNSVAKRFSFLKIFEETKKWLVAGRRTVIFQLAQELIERAFGDKSISGWK